MIVNLTKMKIFKTVIIEDDPIEQVILESHLKKLPYIEIVGIFSNPIEALPVVNSGEINILFLDINLPELNGIEFSNLLTSPPKTIVISAFTTFAIDAFDVGAVDYIVKPYTFERLLKGVNRAIESVPKYKSPTDETYIFLKSGRDLLKFFLEKIEYFEAYGSFTKVYSDGKVTVLSESISVVQDKLPPYTFIRVHKSYLVSKEKITGVSTKNVTLDKIKIPLGLSYREEIEKALGREFF